MKKLSLLYVLIMVFTLPLIVSAQTDKKEVRVKTIKVVDGKKTVTDTVFTSTEDMDSEIEMMIESLTETDSIGNKTIRIELKSDGIESEEQAYEVVVFSGDHSDEHIMVSPSKGTKKAVRWIDEDGEEQVFEFEFEIDDIVNMNEDIEHQVRVIMEQTEDIEMDLEALEAVKAEHMIFLKELPPPPPKPVQIPEMYWVDSQFGGNSHASEKELRAAGIKNQPDLLQLNELDIDNRKGVITLRFSPKEEQGSPKVVVYNFYGEKVFSGKPDLVGGVFQITMDLSTKQPGTYYIQIVQKKSSVTERIRL